MGMSYWQYRKEKARRQARQKAMEEKLALIPSKLSLPVHTNYFDFCNWLYPETGVDGQHCDPQDYHLEYHDVIAQYNDVILNKSRKIGATQSVLKSIYYFTLTGFYARHNGIIIAGNRQAQANEFIARMVDLIKGKQYTLEDGSTVSWDHFIHKYSANKIEFFNGFELYALPASPEFGGMENVALVFFSEAAKTKLNDDRPVYSAFKPVVATMPEHHFILESTPNGRRGFFYEIWMRCQQQLANGETPDYYPLEIPYTRALGTVLSPEVVEKDKRDPTLDFEQEYCCKFTTSLNAAFKEELVAPNYIPDKVTDWSDILGAK